MELIIYILYSINQNFSTNNYYKIQIIKKIGEGTYGYVYEINNNLVIKIFKNYTKIIKDYDENNIVPKKNENREVNFFLSYMNSNFKNNDYLIKINCIGLVKFNNFNNYNIINNFCLILPNCVPIMKLVNQWKMPLIKNNNGKELVLKLMKRLIEIEIFLNINFNLSNLDIKLSNFMINKYNKIDIKNIIAIDFGLTINRNKKLNKNYKHDYFIWPENVKNIDYFPSYSICINGLILFLGLKTIKKITIENNLKYIKDDIDFYQIFYNGLILNIKCKDLYIMIEDYFKKNKIKY